MKKIILLGMGVLFLFSIIHSDIAEPEMRVTSVRVEVSQREFIGRCPHKFEFTGYIQVNRAGTVRYRWLRSDKATAPEETLTFLSSGTKEVTSTWSLGSAGSMNHFVDHWKGIEIIAPNSMRSNLAVFNLKCIPMFQYPSYEISGNLTKERPEEGMGPSCMKVKVILTSEGRVKGEKTITLDENGAGHYFFSRTIGAGTYQIRVESAPSTHPRGLNVNFNGTIPESRSVTLTSGSQHSSGQDFVIKWSICWDSPPCWYDGD